MKNNTAETKEIIDLAARRASAAGEPPFSVDWLSPLKDGTEFLCIRKLMADSDYWLKGYTIVNRSKMSVLLQSESDETYIRIRPGHFCDQHALIEILGETSG